MGSVENGKALFTRMCSMCHTTSKDGKHKIGPNLYGIVGKSSGSAAGFNYSDAMRKKNVTWNDKNLSDYLESPKAFVPGTRMVFNGLKKPSDREDVIAYLKTVK